MSPEHNNPISEEVLRFILRSIDSVPHLEAILIFHRGQHDREWDAKAISQELYISEKKAAGILVDLSESGFIAVRQDVNGKLYRYEPKSLQLEKLISELDAIYVKNLIPITNIIHSKVSKQAQDFGDAFKWQKDGD